MKLPDIDFTEWLAQECGDGLICYASLRLETMPGFLYTPVVLYGARPTPEDMSKLISEARRGLLRKARAIKAELNAIDLGVETSAK